MEFFNYIHCKYTGLKGFLTAYSKRFNRAIQEELIDYFAYLLADPNQSNRRPVDCLIFYNTERVHCVFQNKLSPVQFMVQWQEQKLLPNQQINQLIKMPARSNLGWYYTLCCKKFRDEIG